MSQAAHDVTSVLTGCGRDVEKIFGRSPDATCRIDEHGWLGLTGAKDCADLNMAYVAHTAPESLVKEFIDEIGDIAAIMIIDAEATHLTDAATKLGWAAVGAVPVMLWENGPELRPSEKYNVRIATPDEHEEVCRLAAEGFSLDFDTVLRAIPRDAYTEAEGWVAEHDGELLGTGTLVRSDDHVGVYSMATPAQHQRKGVGRAVLETAMAHHVASGAEVFTLEATEAGFHLYEQLGYKTVGTPTVLVAGESTQFPG